MKQDRYFGLSPRIARWKLNNYFENWLSYRADNFEFWKKIYVLYYKIFDYKYYKGGLHFIKEAIDAHKSKWGDIQENVITRDMIYCLHRFGISFQDYCIYDFVGKDFKYRDSFVADKLRYHYCDILNGKNVFSLMTNKYSCYLAYKDFFKRDVLGCFSMEDRPSFDSFLNNHVEFIYKPLDGHSGHGVAKYNSGEIRASDFFAEKLKLGPFIIEELIRQNPEISEVHPQSVNSFRVLTFTMKGKVNVLGVTWRIGVGNAIMDNAGAGGIYARVDPLLGIVDTDAINYKGEHFDIHPDTGVKIVGYKIPKWSEALTLIHNMATHVEETTLISWDIACSDKGWLMLEANDNGDWSIIQSNSKEGKKMELYLLMDKYFESKK